VERHIGSGGWGYFRIGGEDSLNAYAKAFAFVEVNTTFYEHPDQRTVASWRRRVPAGFRFSVRAHRAVTHVHCLRATAAARASLARTAAFARSLNALAVVLETPGTLRIARPEVGGLRDLLASASVPCPVALEARAYAERDLPAPLAATMEELDIADAADFSRQEPRTEATIAYGRLFGQGKGNRWEFTDDELLEAQVRAESRKGDHVVYAFHGVRMYKDAARFLTYVRTGKFPKATRSTGVGSLEEVLKDGAEFPATKDDLVREHGWRVVDVTADRRTHASELLDRLAAGRYSSAKDVGDALRAQSLADGRLSR
jgi:uncharacterized protein YecE (DUF72 family)